MSRTSRVLSGLLVSYTLFFFGNIVRFFLTPFFLRVIGPELMGLRSFVDELLHYARLSDFGLGSTVQAVVAKEMQDDQSKEDKEKTIGKLRTASQIQHIIAFIIFILSIVLAIFIDKLVQGLQPENYSEARFFTLLIGLTIALTFSSSTFTAILVGKQRMAENGIYNLLYQGIMHGLGFLLVYIGWSLYGLGVAGLIAALYLIIQVRIRSSKIGVHVNPFTFKFEKHYIPELYRISIWFVLSHLGVMIGLSSARIITGVYPTLGLSDVTNLSLLMMVPVAIRVQANRVAAMTRPGLTQLYHSKASLTEIRKPAILQLKFCSVLAVTVFVVLWLVNGGFVIRWVGAQFYPGDQANLIVAITNSIIILNVGFKSLLEMQFNFKKVGIISLVSGVTGVIISIALVKKFGLSGILLGALLSELIFKIPVYYTSILRWMNSEDRINNLVLKIFTVPILLLGSWILVGNYVQWRPGTWIEIGASALFIGGITFTIGITWLWKELRYYPGFAKIDKFMGRFTSR